MASTSFGEWYESQKKTNLLQESSSSTTSSFWRRSSDTQDVESMGLLSRTKRIGSAISGIGDAMKEVFAFFGLALVFFIIAYFIGLPTLLIRPAKFSISFAMGSLMTILGLARLRGYSAYFSSMLHSDNLWKSVLYFGSLILSIFCAVVWKSYIATVLSSLLQIFVLVLFVMESFPAGSRIASLFLATLRKGISMILSLISRFVSSFVCLKKTEERYSCYNPSTLKLFLRRTFSHNRESMPH